MLPPECGVPTVRRELVSGNGSGEVVVAGRLGAWLEERDPTGGLDAGAGRGLPGNTAPRPAAGRQDRRRASCHGGVEIETTLDPKEQPFLYDHAPDPETPWLPGVMATEAMAEAALRARARLSCRRGRERADARRVQVLPHGAADAVPERGRDVGKRTDELVVQTTLRSVTQPPKEGLPRRSRSTSSRSVRLRGTRRRSTR